MEQDLRRQLKEAHIAQGRDEASWYCQISCPRACGGVETTHHVDAVCMLLLRQAQHPSPAACLSDTENGLCPVPSTDHQ